MGPRLWSARAQVNRVRLSQSRPRNAKRADLRERITCTTGLVQVGTGSSRATVAVDYIISCVIGAGP